MLIAETVEWIAASGESPPRFSDAARQFVTEFPGLEYEGLQSFDEASSLGLYGPMNWSPSK